MIPGASLNTAPSAVGSLGRDGGERALPRGHWLACGPGGGLQVQNRRFRPLDGATFVFLFTVPKVLLDPVV